MRKNKRLLALAMAVTMAATTLSVPAGNVNAEEPAQEYVVMAKNDAGYDKAEAVCGDSVMDSSDELADNNILVAEMTEKEAKKLEKDKNILLVEEDIAFEGSDFEDESFEDVFGSELGLNESYEIKKFLKELRADGEAAVDAADQWNIDAVSANDKEYEAAVDRIKVAVVDTGITATDDIDVAERVNFIEGEENVHPLYEDVSGHGTSVASIIAAKDNSKRNQFCR